MVWTWHWTNSKSSNDLPCGVCESRLRISTASYPWCCVLVGSYLGRLEKIDRNSKHLSRLLLTFSRKCSTSRVKLSWKDAAGHHEKSSSSLAFSLLVLSACAYSSFPKHQYDCSCSWVHSHSMKYQSWLNPVSFPNPILPLWDKSCPFNCWMLLKVTTYFPSLRHQFGLATLLCFSSQLSAILHL